MFYTKGFHEKLRQYAWLEAKKRYPLYERKYSQLLLYVQKMLELQFRLILAHFVIIASIVVFVKNFSTQKGLRSSACTIFLTIFLTLFSKMCCIRAWGASSRFKIIVNKLIAIENLF